MHGEDPRRGQCCRRRQEPLQTLPGQQHCTKMQQQIDQVIQQWIRPAHLVVQPQRELRERTRLLQREEILQSAARETGIREDGISVKVKAPTERSTKSNQRSGNQKKARTGHLLRAYVKRPKTAAERQARIATILARLDEMYPGATCALHHPDPWEL